MRVQSPRVLARQCQAQHLPQYGQVVIPTEPPATLVVELVETNAPEATLTPTPRPDAKERAIEWVKIALTYDAQVNPQQEDENRERGRKKEHFG